jgi:hypothetical protein
LFLNSLASHRSIFTRRAGLATQIFSRRSIPVSNSAAHRLSEEL